ncbi:MAG: protein kinase domain-containing protein [Anaerolineae bacterium]
MAAKRILRDRYRLERLVGRGGTAEVYVATDMRRQVDVAVKVLREDLAEDPEFVERFLREAEALARLDHPYIVRFYSFERDGGTAFIVMDYVPGTTLRAHLLEAGRPLPLSECTAILRQVGAALHYAHALGYVHRDIKPANVMLRSDGAALLSDFGIARAAEGATITLGPLGTPAYMSPEQIAGREVGPGTDIYSLGVVLFEMVTGRRPFVGDTGAGNTTVERVRDEHLTMPPPDPHRFCPTLPAEAAAVIWRALAKDPAARWPDVTSMAEAWERALAGVPLPGIPPSAAARGAAPARQSPVLWAIAIVAVLLLGTTAVGASILLRSRETTTATAQAVALATATKRPPTPVPEQPSPTATTTLQALARATATSTATATPKPLPATPTPTRDVEAELYAALVRYADVRAEAEETLRPDLLAEVCVDPYLSWKMARIEENRAAGSHWETLGADFVMTSVDVRADTAEVWVSKTETKLFYPPGSDKPDDVVCGANIYSYRDCTYDAQYLLVRRDGRWYVSEANAPGSDCETACQQ